MPSRPWPKPTTEARAAGGRTRWKAEFAAVDAAVLALVRDRPGVTLGEIVEALTARRVLNPLSRPCRRDATVALSLQRLEKAGRVEYLGEKADATV